MEVKATKRGFNGKKIVKKDEVWDFNGDIAKLGSWIELTEKGKKQLKALNKPKPKPKKKEES